ncbi:MAG: hypothetical protein KAI24_13635 [Planctomycetes bacterium]|nr:hypothetical protein [Planctomycetota bacterium]
MSLPPSIPRSCVRDPVALVADDGALAAATDEMGPWLARFGTSLGHLPLDDDQRAELQTGEPVVMTSPEAVWELRRAEGDGRVWLVARDVTERERRREHELASQRCRALGRMAASLSHDLNNQFNAVLALAGQLELVAQSHADREAMQELQQGTQLGARLAGLLARMLVRTPARRARVAASALLDDVLGLVAKSVEHAGVELRVTVPPSLPAVRVPEVEVVQAMIGGIDALLALAPASLSLVAGASGTASGAPRERAFVEVRCEAGPVPRQRAEELRDAVELRPGSLTTLARRVVQGRGRGGHAHDLREVMTAALLQRRLGGELACELGDDVVALVYRWPRAR